MSSSKLTKGKRGKKPITREVLSPINLSSNRLSKALERFPQIGTNQRDIWVSEMSTMPSFPYMNMNTLSSALILIYASEQDNVLPEYFQYLIDSVVIPEDNPDIRQREKESVLRYIFTIQNFRTSIKDRRITGIPTNVSEPAIETESEEPIEEFINRELPEEVIVGEEIFESPFESPFEE